MKTKRKKIKNHWTQKFGNTLGEKIKKISQKVGANKKLKLVVILTFLVIFFAFIVPLSSNLVNVIILVILLVLYYVAVKEGDSNN